MRGKSLERIADRLLRIEGTRGHAAERKVLSARLQQGSGLKLAG